MGENYGQSKNSEYYQGIQTQFLAEPVQAFQPKTFVRNQQEAKIIQEEIDTLLENEAMEPIPTIKQSLYRISS